MGCSMRRRSSSLISRSFADRRSRRLLRRIWNRPCRVRPQIWVKPRKSNVSGLPSPSLARRAAAERPNVISRVFSGCNVSANSANRSRIMSRKRRPSAVGLVLEADHDVVRITHDHHVAGLDRARLWRAALVVPMPADRPQDDKAHSAKWRTALLKQNEQKPRLRLTQRETLKTTK